MDVLITDDSGFMRDLLREILEEDHTIVGEAENGVEAVELYQEETPRDGRRQCSAARRRA